MICAKYCRAGSSIQKKGGAERKKKGYIEELRDQQLLSFSHFFWDSPAWKCTRGDN
jgi:hypothetical protein